MKSKRKEEKMEMIKGANVFTVKVNNDKTGDITADNVVIYGNHTGNISAHGEKSVVVIFGDVTGDITANQVIRLDKSNMEAGKHLINGIDHDEPYR